MSWRALVWIARHPFAALFAAAAAVYLNSELAAYEEAQRRAIG